MNIQDLGSEGNTNPLPDALAPPSDVGAQADPSAETTETPTTERTPEQDSAYAEAVRSMRRAHLPQAAIDSMEEADVLAWHTEYSPVQTGIDQAFQRAKELERELEALKSAQATPEGRSGEGMDAAKLEELGLDPKVAEVFVKLLDERLVPIQETFQESQQRAGEQALAAQFQALQADNPTLSDPRVRLKVQEKAELLFGAYGDPKAALLDAVAIVTGSASAQAPDLSKERGQPGVGSQRAAAPQSTYTDMRSLAREIISKNRQ